MTLTAFVLARLMEDEAATQAVHGVTVTHYPRWLNGERVTPKDPSGPFAPERVLADCEAKRRIVEWTEARAICDTHGSEYDTGCRECLFAADTVDYDRVVLTHLAAVYADHPDYRDEWKP